jgi:hypothetical protein
MRTAGPEGPAPSLATRSAVRAQAADDAGLEGDLAVLDVDRELHVLHVGALHQLSRVGAQLGRELVVGEVVDALVVLDLELHELLEDLLVVGLADGVVLGGSGAFGSLSRVIRLPMTVSRERSGLVAGIVKKPGPRPPCCCGWTSGCGGDGVVGLGRGLVVGLGHLLGGGATGGGRDAAIGAGLADGGESAGALVLAALVDGLGGLEAGAQGLVVLVRGAGEVGDGTAAVGVVEELLLAAVAHRVELAGEALERRGDLHGGEVEGEREAEGEHEHEGEPVLAGHAVAGGLAQGGHELFLSGGGGLVGEDDEHGAVVAGAGGAGDAADGADAGGEALADAERLGGADGGRFFAVLSGELGEGVADVLVVDLGVLEGGALTDQRGGAAGAEDLAEEGLGPEVERVDRHEASAVAQRLRDLDDLEGAAEGRGELLLAIGGDVDERRQLGDLADLLDLGAVRRDHGAGGVEQRDGHLRVVLKQPGVGDVAQRARDVDRRQRAVLVRRREQCGAQGRVLQHRWRTRHRRCLDLGRERGDAGLGRRLQRRTVGLGEPTRSAKGQQEHPREEGRRETCKDCSPDLRQQHDWA